MGGGAGAGLVAKAHTVIHAHIGAQGEGVYTYLCALGAQGEGARLEAKALVAVPAEGLQLPYARVAARARPAAGAV